jgi:hypothetical protein
MGHLVKIDKEQFVKDQSRYSLVKGTIEGAPLCPYGNHYKWVGYDRETKTFVRFTKSVFLNLVNQVKNKY